MLISSTEPATKTVHCYDFMLQGGIMFPITLDLEGGDTLTVTPEAFEIRQTGKPSLLDADVFLAPETTVIYRSNVLMYQFRTAEIPVIQKAQRQEWADQIQNLDVIKSTRH